MGKLAGVLFAIRRPCYYICTYTHHWKVVKSMDSYGKRSLLFVMKVMVWNFVSDFHKVIWLHALSCHLPSVVVEICLQFHSLMCLIVALLEIPLFMPKILCWCNALKLCKDLAQFFKLKMGRLYYSQFPSQWEGDYLSDWDIAPSAGRFYFFGGISRNINFPAPFLLPSPPLSLST